MTDFGPSTEITYFAPAKINLGLAVLGLRGDGYHELHTIMLPLSVGDELSVAPAPDLRLRVLGADLPEDEGNLVYRAARAYLDAASHTGGARLTLHKRLPLASGLGGGSSDAAMTLMALRKLYPAQVDLHALALGLGADVPFFLGGQPAVAEGVGERLSPIPLPRLHLVLANPGTQVSARDAYRWLDAEEEFSPPLGLEAISAALADGGRNVPYLNSLQAPVAARHRQIGEALAALSGAGLHSPLMSGSGSTCFALAASGEAAAQAARAVQAAHPDWWVQAAHSL